MRFLKKSLKGFIIAGHLFSPAVLVIVFMYMLFHDGKWQWVEPNVAVITIEIVLFVAWFAGSAYEAIKVIWKMKRKKE